MNRMPYAIIGAGPSGLAGARNLQKYGIPFVGFEAHSDVGGLWDINNPRSTVYQTAHLISSKKMTEFREFPMAESVADYPSHGELRKYFSDFATHFGLREHFRFNTKVATVEPDGEHWQLTTESGERHTFAGIIIANGTLAEPKIPQIPGNFSGEIFHSSKYKSPKIFEGKRVLIVGAGNSGCDIAVDAVHHAKSVAISVRRGYHFVPKYVLGKPADTMGGLFKLPPRLKQMADGFILKFFTGDPEKFGFPKPDHRIYESHPIVNSLVLYHIGHGDISVKSDIAKLDGDTVVFADGSADAFDLVLLATGYKLHYPFIDRNLLNWQGDHPGLYLHIFHPERDNLFVLGMLEAAGLGWQGRYDQAELMARFIRASAENHASAIQFCRDKQNINIDLSGGYNYMKLERMSFYVHKDTYLKVLHKHLRQFANVLPLSEKTAVLSE